MKKVNSKKQAKKRSLDEDPEIKELFEQTNKDLNPQSEIDFNIKIDFEGLASKNEDLEKLSSEVQSPEKAHTLYYGKLRKILRKYLPKGKEFKKERDLIYDQIKLFLKDGHETGRDSRMAYYYNFEKAVSILIDWVNETNGKDLYDLYLRFKDLNKELGYFENDR